MRRVIATAAILAFSLAVSGAADAKSCKDAKGKFTKCPPAAAAPANKTVTKCKDAKGKFAKCSAPGAKPV